MTKQNDQKAVYETPALTAVGSFEALTKWAGTGWALDAGFTIGTPVSALTFSDPPRS
jgi:hypothetical protein